MSEKSEKIIYPSVDLFVYQLAFGLGADEDKTKANAKKFLANFPEELQEQAGTKIEVLEKQEKLGILQSDLTFFCDRPKEEYPLPNSEKFQCKSYPLEGHYDAARLGDSYGFLLDASVEEEDKKEILKLRSTSSFGEALEPLVAKKSGNLGKTCILYGYLPPGADAEVLAGSIYREFVQKQISQEELAKQNLSKEEFLDWAWKLNQKQRGKFLGADFFVAWQPPQIWEDLPLYRGIYIILYPDPEPQLKILDEAAHFHENWLRLFWFQNKIFWARDQGRELKQKLEENFGKMRETALEIKRINLGEGKPSVSDLDLQHLQSVLKNRSKTIANYALNLSLLEIQQTTLDTNLYNYRLCLEDLEAKAKRTEETDLGVLRQFADIADRRYKTQLQKDYASLKPGLDALENLINPLNSIVDLEQAQRDRDFQANVETWGFGLAIAAVVAATFSPAVPTILKHEKSDRPPEALAVETFVVATAVSLLAGFVARFLAPLFLRIGKKRRG